MSPAPHDRSAPGAADPLAEAPLAEAVARLRAGQLVAFPTETVYGLGADARNPAAMAALYARKGRPTSHPVIVHLASAAQLGAWAAEVPPLAQRLAAVCWPGPLTMILRRRDDVLDAVTGGQDTVGLRVPRHPVALALLERFGDGVAAPSANRFGRVSPTQASHVRAEFGDDLLVLEGGDCEVGLESTIVDLSRLAQTGGRPVLLRPGMLTPADLQAALGVPVLEADAVRTSPRAPGRLASHYAPRTPLDLLDGAQLDAWAANLAARGESLVVYGRIGDRAAHPALGGVWHDAPDDARGYGRALYRALRRLDDLGVAHIGVLAPPRDPPWQAILDRLQRAATR